MPDDQKNKDQELIWMAGTPESVVHDGFKLGPDTEPDVMVLYMDEGDILVGKSRQGEVLSVMEYTDQGLVDIEGGIDALRARLTVQSPDLSL